MPPWTPPPDVRRAAERGLELRAEQPPSNRAGTAVGLARARDLSAGRPVSADVIRRMVSFFARHSAYKDKHTTNPPSNSLISWLLWGGDPGKAWAEKIKAQMDRADEK